MKIIILITFIISYWSLLDQIRVYRILTIRYLYYIATRDNTVIILSSDDCYT